MAHPEPEVGVGMAPSRVQGGPVPAPGVVGPRVELWGFWGVSLGGFLWAFRPGVLVPLFGFFFECFSRRGPACKTVTSTIERTLCSLYLALCHLQELMASYRYNLGRQCHQPVLGS